MIPQPARDQMLTSQDASKLGTEHVPSIQNIYTDQLLSYYWITQFNQHGPKNICWHSTKQIFGLRNNNLSDQFLFLLF